MRKSATVTLLAAAMLPALAGAHVVETTVDPLQDIILAEPMPAKPRAQQTTTEAECRLDEFASTEELDEIPSQEEFDLALEAILALIDAVPVECMDDWFYDDLPASLRADVFSFQNVFPISWAAGHDGFVEDYDSAEGRNGQMGKLFVFLHAYFWNAMNHDDVDGFLASRDSIDSALAAFVQNEQFHDEGDEHARMLSTTTGLTGLLRRNWDRYRVSWDSSVDFEFAKLLMRRVEAGAYVESDKEWEFISGIGGAIRCNALSGVDAFLIGFAKTAADIGVSDRMLDIPDEDHQFVNSFPISCLKRFLIFSDSTAQRPAVLSAVKAEVRRLVNHWEGAFTNGVAGRGKYYAAMGIAGFALTAGKPHLADIMEEFLLKLLPLKYSCGRHVVRAQAGAADRKDVCETMAFQEALFHSVLDTNEKPVPHSDASESVLMFIFNEHVNSFYEMRIAGLPASGVYYGNHYFNDYSVATASRYLNTPYSHTISTVEHEFIHYLDHRYADGDTFISYVWGHGLTGGLVKTVKERGFSMTALASYVRERNFRLSDIIVGGGRQRTPQDHYSATPPALLFMFERHPEVVAEWLHLAYKGDQDSLDDYRSSIGSRYDYEFSSWLDTRAAGYGQLPRIKRKTVDVAAAAVPLMLPAFDSLGQGFVRIINESEESGGVRIPAFDDGETADSIGKIAAGTIEIELGTNKALHFNSDDLEQGNPSKGIHAGVGSPEEGAWRLGVETDLGVRVLSYVRTGDGFLTAMHDTLQKDAEGRLAAHTFNPGRNTNQVSELRLFNTGPADSVSIEGVDDQGNAAGPVTLMLAAGESRTLSALDLENGAEGLTGTLGVGLGKWRLFVDAGHLVFGQSLLRAASGHLTNLSTGGVANAESLAAAVPLMLPAGDSLGQGFVRIVNESEESGSFRILAVDGGGTAAEPIEIELGARQALHFNSEDLEQGNPSKGIYTGVGSPQKGAWRLGVETDLGVRVLSYVRTGDGFLTAMHDRLPRDAEGRLAAQTFNPGQNRNQVSELRLVNTGANAERVSIEGVDDQGNAAGPVTLTLPAGQSRTFSAQDLEGGAQGLTGTLGDGAGKWRLFITAGESVVGMSLLRAASGHLTNLSTSGVATEGQ